MVRTSGRRDPAVQFSTADGQCGRRPQEVPLTRDVLGAQGVLTPIFFVLWRVKVEGREYTPTHGPVVLAANHQSFCDSFLIPLVVRRKVTFLAKAKYFDSWKTAWFFHAAGQIPIRRGGGSVSERALDTARNDVLKKGHILGLYPEGTRTLDPYVHKGRTGVTRLSRECGVPIVPVGVVGTVEVQPVNAKFMRPFKTVTIRFGKPMQMDPPGNPEDPLANHDHTQCRDFAGPAHPRDRPPLGA